LGYFALGANTTGSGNTAVGTSALTANTLGSSNVAVGYLCLDAFTTGDYNVGMGYSALGSETTGSSNVGIGPSALAAQVGASENTAMGRNAGLANLANGMAAFGMNALAANTTGGNNTGIGLSALIANTTGAENTGIGKSALEGCTTGGDNTALGLAAGNAVTTGSNNSFLGHDSGRTGSPGGAVTTHSNRICLGDENISEANVQVDWSIASDQRDKTDFTALDLGLDFVKALAPITYKWDKRSKYGDKHADDYDLSVQTPDGTHKEDWLDIGFKAQAVLALEEAAGYTLADKKNLTVSLSTDGKQYSLQYSKFIPILVKALQEADDKIDALTTRIEALEA